MGKLLFTKIGKKDSKRAKIRVFRVFEKFCHYCLLEVILNKRSYAPLFFCADPCLRKGWFHKLVSKMLSSNQIARFFVHNISGMIQSMSLIFLHGDVASKLRLTFGLVWPGVSSHAQVCLDLLGCLWLVWQV